MCDFHGFHWCFMRFFYMGILNQTRIFSRKCLVFYDTCIFTNCIVYEEYEKSWIRKIIKYPFNAKSYDQLHLLLQNCQT